MPVYIWESYNKGLVPLFYSLLTNYESRTIPIMKQESQQNEAMRKYYEWQSKIYDSTRWSFLFGRHKVIQVLPSLTHTDINILEIGCGTGYNLNKLARKYPTPRSLDWTFQEI